MTTSEYFRTNDMGMAAFLELSGHCHQSVEFSGDTLFWLFLITPGLLKFTDMFANDKASVEPREYSKHYAEIRRSFFDAKDKANR